MDISVLNACDHCCTRIEQLSVRLQNQLILDKVNLHVNCRELLAIVGPNGAGKSTLLKAILGAVPYTGRIIWQIRGKKEDRPRIGYVPQTLDFDREAPVSVADLFASATSHRPVWLGVSKRERLRIAKSLDAVSASHLLGKRIGDLSGGELQRVLLCLALTANPDILLLDEPVAGIDTTGVDLFLTIVKELLASLDIAVLMVTHDLLGVAPHANRMLLLNRRVIAEGTPAEVLASHQMADAFSQPHAEKGLYHRG
ncbi:MAG: metal ABC transporter ATP-binding protein [Syntrophales bacterium]